MRLMTKNNFMIVAFVIGAIFLTCTVARAETYPVEWYEGFNLYDYFEAEKQAVTIDDIKRQLGKDWEFPFNVYSADDRIQESVNNCDGYFKAKESELYPVSNVERGPYSYVGLLCTAAKLIVEGKAAKESYIENIKLDADIATHLPAALEYRISREQPLRTVGNWADVEKLKVTSVTEKEVEYSSEGAVHFVRKIATGDFNGDGKKDLLLLITHGVTEGTHFSQHLYLLTRDNPDGLMEIVKEYSALED